MAPFRREGQGFHKQPLPSLRPAVHETIGRRLRLQYEDPNRQPMPGRLADLLAELERAAEERAASPRQS